MSKWLVGCLFLIVTSISFANCLDDNATSEQNFLKCSQAANLGDSDAQYTLATFYNSGQGVSADAEKAVFWYQKSAEKNNDFAQYSLGVMYEFGQGGLDRDQDKAYELYRLSANNGNYFAKNKLGLIEPSKHEFSPSIEAYPDADEGMVYDEDGKIEQFIDWLLGADK